MKSLLLAFLCCWVLLMGCARGQSPNGSSQGVPGGTGSKSNTEPPPPFDPTRDPKRDLNDAIATAGRSGKRILIDVGGEWCIWCHRLDAFFISHDDLMELRNKNFVVFKVNVSPENKNESFLSSYPKIPGYPHIFILAPDGKLLYSEDTSKLESGDSYSHERVKDFLKKWAPMSGN